MRPAVCLLFLSVGACMGAISQDASPPRIEDMAEGRPGQTTSGAAPAGPFQIGAGGIRRLSRVEYDNVLRDLLGDSTRPAFAKLPEDSADPFDNDYSTQLASGALVEGLETIATEAAARALSDPARRDALVGCKPSGPDDAACLRRFIATFGRRALRRPLTDTEVAAYQALGAYAVEDHSFYTGVELVLRAFLQDPELVYHAEVGTPVAGRPGLLRLTAFETASRLSFFLTGSTPGDPLIDAAQAGRLATDADARAAATALLADPRARQRLDYFHAEWLGYPVMRVSAALADAMRTESDNLVERVLFEGTRDYFELFRSTETFVNDALAANYGFARPGSTAGKWVPYADGLRRGILSHATVLQNGAKFNDTSPVLRGKFIIRRLLCGEVPPPPDNVDTDLKPQSAVSRCKAGRYAAHRSTAPGCAACHALIDPVGWGLENYDPNGRYRTVEADAPECAIDGQGALPGVGPFRGPGELGEMLARSGKLESCVASGLHRFAFGRPLRDADQPTVDRLTAAFVGKQRQFRELVLALVSDPSFFYRQEEQAP